MDYLREGDTLVVTRIDRLARSLRDLQNLVHDLKDEGIELKALEQPVDTGTASGKAFLDMLGVFAEFETNLRKERQLEGIAKAKAEGKYKGRKPTARAKSKQVLDLIGQVYHYREINGATLHPMAAYLLLRGMKTLHLRIRQQNKSALRIARFLENHPAIERVFYPGLKSHEGYEIACRQMRGFGGVLSFMLKENSFEAVRRFLPRLRYCHPAANLGSVETIVGPPATTSHVECTAEERAAMGIPESLVRYSTGIEDTSDLIADLDQALKPFA